MKSIKVLLTACLLAVVSVHWANAQLVLSNFSDFANDANNFTGTGTLYSDANWDTAITQGSNVATVTNANDIGSLNWFFDGTTTNAFSAYTQIGLTANLTGTSLVGMQINFVADDYSTVLASATWTAAELAGSEVIKSISIPLNVGGFNLKYIGGPSSTFSGSIDNLALIAVPEPSTYALLMLGAGAIGVMVRRRRKA